MSPAASTVRPGMARSAVHGKGPEKAFWERLRTRRPESGERSGMAPEKAF